MMEPEAFLATIFIEPILFQMKDQTEAVARMTMRRRDTWNSKSVANICQHLRGTRMLTVCRRADLTAAFQKSASLQDWDRRQLQVYIVRIGIQYAN